MAELCSFSMVLIKVRYSLDALVYPFQMSSLESGQPKPDSELITDPAISTFR